MSLRIGGTDLDAGGFYSFTLLRFLTSTHIETVFLTGLTVSRLLQDVYLSFLPDVDLNVLGKRSLVVCSGSGCTVCVSGTQRFTISDVWRGRSPANRAERLIRLPFRSARLLIQRASACTGSLREGLTVLGREAKINSCVLGTVSLSQQRFGAGAPETRSLEHLERVNQAGQ